jgi:SM-20-related protein
MPSSFDILIDTYIQNKIGIAQDFIDATLSTQLIQHIDVLLKEDKFVAAGTGISDEVILDLKFRNDSIYWLDRKNQSHVENQFLDHIDLFVHYLNTTCYTGITGYEFHFAVYKKGNFYKKHFDQFKYNKSRAYTMIFYLNKNWKEGDGGELCIHSVLGIELISPDEGKSIFFKSNEIEHEVLLNHKTRMSITGWLRTD